MHDMLSKLSGVAPIRIGSVEQERMLSMLAEGIPDDHDLQGGSTVTWRLLPIHMHFLYTNLVPRRFPQSLSCLQALVLRLHRMQICRLVYLIKHVDCHGCFLCAQCRPMDSDVHTALMLRRPLPCPSLRLG